MISESYEKLRKEQFYLQEAVSGEQPYQGINELLSQTETLLPKLSKMADIELVATHTIGSKIWLDLFPEEESGISTNARLAIKRELPLGLTRIFGEGFIAVYLAVLHIVRFGHMNVESYDDIIDILKTLREKTKNNNDGTHLQNLNAKYRFIEKGGFSVSAIQEMEVFFWEKHGGRGLYTKGNPATVYLSDLFS